MTTNLLHYSLLRRRVLLLSLFFVLSAINAKAQLTWQVTRNLRQFNDIVQFNNQLIAVGSGGSIFTSSDGLSWKGQSTFGLLNTRYGSLKDLNSIVVGNGRLVVVGQDGVLLTSQDGTNWNLQPSGTTYHLRSIIYADGQFVAVGGDYGSAVVVTSSDGKSWTARYPSSPHLSGISWGNGMYVAVGRNGTLLISNDARNWQPQISSTTKSLYTIIYGLGQFIAAGNDGTIVGSSDGISWTSRMTGTDYDLVDIAYGNGQFVTVGYNSLYTSSDGITWKRFLSNCPYPVR